MKDKILSFLLIFLNLTVLAQGADEQFDVFNVRNETDGSTVVYATNNYPCEESVLIEFSVLKNMKADVELPYKGVVPAGAKEFKLFTLSIKDRTKGSQLGYITKYCHGDIFNPKQNKDYVYTIPYREGEQYPIGQAYGGKFSHYMKGKTHAIDFTMDEGTPICAARGGVVIFVKDDSNKSGKTIKYQDYGNYITIYHEDGTLANYFHIKKGGSKVKVGEKVNDGQVIAMSGNTGWSSGPHLHFQVYSFDEEMEMKSIPTKFRQADGKAIILKLSKEGYQSVH
jgi:murein DD-endopeptidase MepM/ murein hydrolase activator NlpD